MSRLVLGTRGSPLALWQSRHVARRLRSLHPGMEIDERIIRTKGDVEVDRPLGPGDRGAFVRRIEEALLAGEIDLAVHSLKDLPTTQPDGLTLGAIPERHDPRDALLSADGLELAGLPRGARVATGSPRRRTQLLRARADLQVVPVRGNVDTRVRKLVEGQFDALVLALAGLERLGIDEVPHRALEVSVCLPAVGQGALAVEVRGDDGRVSGLVAGLDDPMARAAVEAERSFLRRLGGGCLAPATAYATIREGRLVVSALVGDLEGRTLLTDTESGPTDSGVAMGERLAERLLQAGAGALLEQARQVP